MICNLRRTGSFIISKVIPSQNILSKFKNILYWWITVNDCMTKVCVELCERLYIKKLYMNEVHFSSINTRPICLHFPVIKL